MDTAFWDMTWQRPYGQYNRHHQEIWQAILPKLHGRVLDLGCGPCVMYQKQSLDLTGVDWSKIALQEARKNYPAGKFLRADVRSTGLPGKSFDTVLLLGVLDYFPDWNEVLIEARRLARGRIMATLLDGFEGHDWTAYPKVTGPWHLYEETI